ncbi:peptide chain release factor 1 eRF1 [Catovirus CTV1]|uniref:Peptide chain release factor 1 eRF1 n=1 Tax=Catovirus CTV1 TaxID=1977631 RepID=A0A1V0SB02_9VIRU|nr:peptide chain release factor 1 eRF1 [Catovirus CTV1]
MYKSSTKYGICLVSGKEFRCYVLQISGDHREFKLLRSDDQKIMNKHKTGGQSAVRFQRLRDIQIDHYIKHIVDNILVSYFNKDTQNYFVEKIIIAGPGSIKHDIVQTDIFKQYFSNKLLKIVNTSEITDETINNVYENCYDLLEDKETIKSKKIIQVIDNLIKIDADKLVFGYDEVITALKSKSLKTIIISKLLDNKISSEIESYNDYKCEIVTANDEIKNYGNMVGIKWY